MLYRTVAGHFETWLALSSDGQFDGQGEHHTPPAYVEQAFRKYLECGIFAHGFPAHYLWAAHRRASQGPTHRPGTRATAVGRL